MAEMPFFGCLEGLGPCPGAVEIGVILWEKPRVSQLGNPQGLSNGCHGVIPRAKQPTHCWALSPSTVRQSAVFQPVA